MGTVYDAIEGRLRDFLLAQHVFFVATAPSGPQGHVNVSPKGPDRSDADLAAYRAEKNPVSLDGLPALV